MASQSTHLASSLTDSSLLIQREKLYAAWQLSRRPHVLKGSAVPVAPFPFPDFRQFPLPLPDQYGHENLLLAGS